MSTNVSPQYLLKGAVYSLEQCGLLLRDANVLYRGGSYATAVVLAAFAREELGQWKILRDLRREAVGGEQFTIDYVKACCEDHETKQKAGVMSITMHGRRDSGFGRLMDTAHTNPGSKEWTDAREELEQLTRVRTH